MKAYPASYNQNPDSPSSSSALPEEGKNLGNEAPVADVNAGNVSQTEIALSQLKQLLRDAAPVISDTLYFEAEDDTLELKCRTEWGTYSEGYSIEYLEDGSVDAPEKKWLVLRAVLIRGVRYTRNGDGWPDEIDMQEIESFPALYQAFECLMVEWFREQVARCIQSAAEDRMVEEQAKEELL